MKEGFYLENFIMHTWYYLLPLATALIGFSINSILLIYFFRPYHPKKVFFFDLHGFLPSKRTKICNALVNYIVEEIPFEILLKKITSEENIATVIPVAEHAIDDFLNKKLVEKMPMLSMFVSERLLNDLKNIFIEELTVLLPVMITEYAQQFNNKEYVRNIIKKYFQTFDNKTIEIFIRKQTPLIKAVQWWGLIVGFLIGCFQVLFLYFILSVQ
jgi:uncharacterized membrane protein YheB (UPF0754 family)